MMRRLLACLALITGLTAAGAPAHAAVDAALGAQQQSRCAQAAEQRQERRAAHYSASATAQSTPLYSASAPLVQPHRAPPAAKPGILLRIDRARE